MPTTSSTCSRAGEQPTAALDTNALLWPLAGNSRLDSGAAESPIAGRQGTVSGVRIVITGASGNVGTALLQRLTSHDLVGIARRPPVTTDPPYGDVTWRSIDVSTATAARDLRAAFQGADAVVHLVWAFQPTRRTEYLRRVGVGGTQAVVEAVAAAGVPHLVHMSSVGAYAPGAYGTRVDENWPTTGTADFSYSNHKAAAERVLDELERTDPPDLTVARVRPGLVVQRQAASALLRYGAPGIFAPGLLRYVALLPLDKDFVVPVVHAADVADAVARIVEQTANGAFNLAAEPPVTRDVIARLLGARTISASHRLLRTAASLSWRLRVQPVDPGWVDLAFGVPLLDTTRARTQLGWRPRYDSREAVADLLGGMVDRAGTASPALRPRSVIGQLTQAARQGAITDRLVP